MVGRRLSGKSPLGLRDLVLGPLRTAVCAELSSVFTHAHGLPALLQGCPSKTSVIL